MEPESLIIVKIRKCIEKIENGVINPYHIFEKAPKDIIWLVTSVESGLRDGKHPRLALEGTSGSYFLRNHEDKTVALYKPFDEEPYAPNNPRKYVG